MSCGNTEHAVLLSRTEGGEETTVVRELERGKGSVVGERAEDRGRRSFNAKWHGVRINWWRGLRIRTVVASPGLPPSVAIFAAFAISTLTADESEDRFIVRRLQKV